MTSEVKETISLMENLLDSQQFNSKSQVIDLKSFAL